MVTVDTQVHGYLRGHQLLSSSVDLPKADQAVIDRLSDVAGPLRPSEKFEPYLSGYPLPGGDRYVLARTWQDLIVKRAGCVRTMSLIIPAFEWAAAKTLAPFLDLLDPSTFPEPGEAKTREIAPSSIIRPISPVPHFRGGEFLEALFLEETKPIAVFDAPSPELIAIRLLTAVWPDFRRQFAFSAFARSPRRIEGRPFDLVFAPKDARSKFADWPGRRIDGVADSAARHRWTGDIVERVFVAPVPQLLSEQDVALAGPKDAKTAALLRISLLWDELLGKISATPTAALGLLDIANSRGVWNSETLETLDQAINTAVQSGVANMPPELAWELLTALVRKMGGHRLLHGRIALRDAAARLSISSPTGATVFLSQSMSDEVVSDLLPRIANGMARASDAAMSNAMLSAAPDVLGRVIAATDEMARRVATEPRLLDVVRAAIPEFEPHLLTQVRDRLLPLLVEERQVALAALLIGTLDADGLMDEVRHLDAAVSLAVPGFVGPIVDRARALDLIGSLRRLLADLPPSNGRDHTLFATLSSSFSDVSWLVGEHHIPAALVGMWLVTLLRSASSSELSAIFNDAGLRGRVLKRLPAEGLDVKRRILSDGGLPLSIHLALLAEFLPVLDQRERRDRASDALARCLRTHFGQGETGIVVQLLGAVGASLDGAWVTRHGLEYGVPASVVSRNLIAFDMAPAAARARLIASVDELARALEGRHVIDIDGPAINSAAHILADASHHAWPAALAASGRILPLLMRSRREPVSPLVAVAFPAVYRELGKADEVPDVLKFIPFLDWDRCKSARHELVAAFLASSAWAPGDLAITSCRCGDIGRIFRRVARSSDGEAYLSRVTGDLRHVQTKCRNAVEKAISDIRSDWTFKYDWRD